LMLRTNSVRSLGTGAKAIELRGRAASRRGRPRHRAMKSQSWWVVLIAESTRPLTCCLPFPTWPALAQLAPVVSNSTFAKLLLFFLKAGSLTFGSGLVIVPFLEQGLVQQYNWLDERQFLIAVAIGMISPGPVVITATFVGYLVAGFWGSLVSTIGIFFPSFILVLVAAPVCTKNLIRGYEVRESAKLTR
jgi:putative chromate ion transporter